ncbi:MAG: class I SAM-dependent methyltransferase [Myxococcota bacterium]
MSKRTRVDDALHGYQLAHRTPDDAILSALRRETREKTGRRAGMQIAAEQGTLLGLLVAAIGARRVIEVGTFTGYSALCMARALPPDGQLIACDVSEEFTAIARRAWEKAGVSGLIDLRLGPAVETLRSLPDGEDFDFAFIDADKESYEIYYEEILARLRPGGLVALDNVFMGGRVVDPESRDPSTRAIRAINDHVAVDARVQSVMLAISDGLTLARKLS